VQLILLFKMQSLASRRAEVNHIMRYAGIWRSSTRVPGSWV